MAGRDYLWRKPKSTQEIADAMAAHEANLRENEEFRLKRYLERMGGNPEEERRFFNIDKPKE